MKTGFFQEGVDNDSVMRLIFFGGIIWAALFTTVFAFYAHLKVGEIVALFGGISGPFFALKLIQKTMEKKPEPDKNTP